MMLFKLFLLLFLISFSAYVLADGGKNCSGSFQNEEEISNDPHNRITQSPAKGPKKANPRLSSSKLLAILNNPASSVADRKEAVRQSLFLTKERGIVVLEKALDDASIEVRMATIEVAVSMGEIALNVLNKAFADSSPEVQKELMQSIVLMSDRLIAVLTTQGLQITLKSN